MSSPLHHSQPTEDIWSLLQVQNTGWVVGEADLPEKSTLCWLITWKEQAQQRRNEGATGSRGGFRFETVHLHACAHQRALSDVSGAFSCWMFITAFYEAKQLRLPSLKSSGYSTWQQEPRIPAGAGRSQVDPVEGSVHVKAMNRWRNYTERRSCFQLLAVHAYKHSFLFLHDGVVFIPWFNVSLKFSAHASSSTPTDTYVSRVVQWALF